MSLDWLPTLTLPALALLLATSLLLLLGRDWRWMLAALAVQYLGVWLILALTLPVSLAIVKMLAGLAAVGMLWVGAASQPEPSRQEYFAPSSRLFRLLIAVIVLVAMYSMAPAIESWLPAPDRFSLLAGLTLIGLGLLQLGLTTQVLRVTMGLLTVFAGFEIVYAFVENSALVTGLLAALIVGLGLTGAYLMIVPLLEETE